MYNFWHLVSLLHTLCVTDNMPKRFMKLCIIWWQFLHIPHRPNESERLVYLARGHFTEKNLHSYGLNCWEMERKWWLRNPKVLALSIHWIACLTTENNDGTKNYTINISTDCARHSLCQLTKGLRMQKETNLLSTTLVRFFFLLSLERQTAYIRVMCMHVKTVLSMVTTDAQQSKRK